MVQKLVGGSEFGFGVMGAHALNPSHGSDACFPGRHVEVPRP